MADDEEWWDFLFLECSEIEGVNHSIAQNQAKKAAKNYVEITEIR